MRCRKWPRFAQQDCVILRATRDMETDFHARRFFQRRGGRAQNPLRQKLFQFGFHQSESCAVGTRKFSHESSAPRCSRVKPALRFANS